MNSVSAQILPPLHERRCIIATDLDGTFLGGSEADRLRLYRWIEENRRTIGLIFVTGRDPDFIGSLVDGTPVPRPEYAVGDVGTTIAQIEGGEGATRVSPIPDLEAEIAQAWADSGPRVRAALDGHSGLKLQPTEFRYRVSYDLDPAAYDDSAEGKVAEMGLDHLISDNRFFDVLPKGVSKGPSIRRLISHLGIAEDRVIVAGDTMNDYSMLASGLNAVAVGGSEALLTGRLAGHPNVHHASAIGAAGILEAIAAFGLHDIPKGEAAHAL